MLKKASVKICVLLKMLFSVNFSFIKVLIIGYKKKNIISLVCFYNISLRFLIKLFEVSKPFYKFSFTFCIL